MHVVRDENRWAIVVEALGYNPRAGNLIDVLDKFGNCIGSPGAGDDDFIGRLDNYEELWLLKRTIARGTPPAALLCKAGLRHVLP